MSFSKTIFRFAAATTAATLLTACQPGMTADDGIQNTVNPVVTGAVSAADPRAQAAGEAMLAAGGSATDAAIATMLALTVVEPQSSGIGGGGFMVLGASDGTVTSFDGREKAPTAAHPGWFLDSAGKVRNFRESVLSGKSIGVPGNIHLAARAHAQHGKLPWKDLFEPAITLAREGFAMNRRLNNSLSGNIDRAGRSDAARKLFYTAAGEPKPVGTIIRNPEFARTLTMLAESGAEAFYSGEMAQGLALAVSEDTPGDAAMTAADIEAYSSKSREAVCGTYRDYRICGMGPPSSGGVAVLQILGQLERFDLAALGPDNPVTWHLFLESQRLAYADRELYSADSDFISVPVAGLVDRGYLAKRSAMIDAERAMPSVAPGQPDGAILALADGDEPTEQGTSHFAVVDAAGTMISYTSTIEGAFGSGLWYKGFYLNNELTDFSRSPTVDGKLVANRVEGGKRPRSSMAPTIIYSPDGKPFVAIGAAGGTTIPVQTARSIVGIIDFKMPVDKAMGLPLLMAFGQYVLVEKDTWFERDMDVFKAMGHENIGARKPPLKAGGLQWHGGRWISARDPRLDGMLETTPR